MKGTKVNISFGPKFKSQDKMETITSSDSITTDIIEIDVEEDVNDVENVTDSDGTRDDHEDDTANNLVDNFLKIVPDKPELMKPILKCALCQYETNSMSKLKVHNLSIHEGVEFSCCRAYSTEQELQRHRTLYHGGGKHRNRKGYNVAGKKDIAEHLQRNSSGHSEKNEESPNQEYEEFKSTEKAEDFKKTNIYSIKSENSVDDESQRIEVESKEETSFKVFVKEEIEEFLDSKSELRIIKVEPSIIIKEEPSVVIKQELPDKIKMEIDEEPTEEIGVDESCEKIRIGMKGQMLSNLDIINKKANYHQPSLLDAGGQFKCKLCGFITEELVFFKSHRLTVHGLKFACGFCEYQTASETSLKTHRIVIHQGIKPKCCKAFSDPVELVKHQIIRHGGGEWSSAKPKKEPPKAIPNPPREPLYKCNQCNYTNKKYIRLRVHQQRVHEKYLNACYKCNFRASKRTTLEQHMIEHAHVHAPGGRLHSEWSETATGNNQNIGANMSADELGQNKKYLSKFRAAKTDEEREKLRAQNCVEIARRKKQKAKAAQSEKAYSPIAPLVGKRTNIPIGDQVLPGSSSSSVRGQICALCGENYALHIKEGVGFVCRTIARDWHHC